MSCVFLPPFVPFVINLFSVSSCERFWTENRSTFNRSTFSYFLKWFFFFSDEFLPVCLIFFSRLCVIWSCRLGCFVKQFVWGFMSQIQLIVFGLCWKWSPFFTVADTLGSGLLAQLFLMFLVLFECLWKPFFFQKKEKTDSTRGCEMCYSTYESFSSSRVYWLYDIQALRHKLTSVDCLITCRPSSALWFYDFYGCMLKSNICVDPRGQDLVIVDAVTEQLFALLTLWTFRNENLLKLFSFTH